ncbi:hypothetical protein K474DRAFT_1709170 [Panus rudis PR-1116 ss-1]|nr:hypothetical protein K474DRAFT_1709170 [Panus rudis PR-1116 ss-1]
MSVASIIDTIARSVTYPIPNNQLAPSRGALVTILHLTSIRTPKFLLDLCCNSEDHQFITNILVFAIHKYITFPMAYQCLAGYLGAYSMIQIITPGQVFDFIATRYTTIGIRRRNCNNCAYQHEDSDVTSVIEHVQCPAVTEFLPTDVDVYNTYVDHRLIAFDCIACGSGMAVDKLLFFAPPPIIGMSVMFPTAPCIFFLSGAIERGIGESIYRWILFAEIWRNAESYSIIVHVEPDPDPVHPTERLIGTRVADDTLVLELLYYRVS